MSKYNASKHRAWRTALSRLPDQHINSSQWQALLLILTEVPALRGLIRHIDFQKSEIAVDLLRRDSRHCSHGEQFLLALALHLYNADNPLPADGLAGLQILDQENFSLSQLAMRIAYRSNS